MFVVFGKGLQLTKGPQRTSLILLGWQPCLFCIYVIVHCIASVGTYLVTEKKDIP